MSVDLSPDIWNEIQRYVATGVFAGCHCWLAQQCSAEPRSGGSIRARSNYLATIPDLPALVI
jgi:hypothetical protein